MVLLVDLTFFLGGCSASGSAAFEDFRGVFLDGGGAGVGERDGVSTADIVSSSSFSRVKPVHRPPASAERSHDQIGRLMLELVLMYKD